MVDSIPTIFELPNSPQQRCLDRFSIADLEEDEHGLVPFWPLLVETLKQPVTSSGQLIDVLDTISNLLRGSSGVAGDYGTLKLVVDQAGSNFFRHIWPKIVRLALHTPDYFLDSSLPVLRSGHAVSLKRGQAACLVAHQFLCSLRCPPWRDGFYDFSIWYASEQRHPAAVDMYFASLFDYLEHLDIPERLSELHVDNIEDVVSYTLHATPSTMSTLPSWSKRLSTIDIIQVERFSTEQQELSYQGPSGAVVVSANKHIGFGQSATQEEIFIGNCPEACPAVLVTPPLKHTQALIIEGAAPMLRIIGQRRDISWAPLSAEARRGGRMLLMDALEIDEVDDEGGLPDLKPDNLDREVRKAYTAFSSWDATPALVWTGVWGCGAFNGDPAVKTIILWIAASLAGKKLLVVCDPSHGDLSLKFSQFVERVPSSWTVRDLRLHLDKIPKDSKRLETTNVLERLL